MSSWCLDEGIQLGPEPARFRTPGTLFKSHPLSEPCKVGTRITWQGVGEWWDLLCPLVGIKGLHRCGGYCSMATIQSVCGHKPQSNVPPRVGPHLLWRVFPPCPSNQSRGSPNLPSSCCFLAPSPQSNPKTVPKPQKAQDSPKEPVSNAESQASSPEGPLRGA